MAAAMLLPPWPWAPVVVICVTALALGPARVRPRTWWLAYSAAVGFAAFAVVPLWWGQGFGHWDASVYAPPLRSMGASAALLLLGLTTPMEEWLALAWSARVPPVAIDLAYLTYRFLLAAADEAAAMQRMLRMRAPGVRWRARLDAAAMLASSSLERTLARAGRMEFGLAARGVDGPVIPVGPFVRFSPLAAIRLAVLPLLLLAGGLR
jgi:cobalt/nickel transport system permease protein